MFKKGFAVFLIFGAVYWSFLALKPTKISDLNTSLDSFSTERAFVHLKEISKTQHPLGSEAHAEVRSYLMEVLSELGAEPEIQEGYAMSQWGNLAKAKNIVARIKGSEQGKALLLLSHYDSAHHSAVGASDAGSGVVTILEGLRSFLNKHEHQKNDIIIVFTDGEELGLNGADLFVNQHPWAKDVGLVLNFEARGSGGPSYMLIETNGGNSNLINEFSKANPKFPVANSLAYSIYKMLPNDTDLTRFRVDGDIDGFNFAFIDDHFDYHTSQDNHERLDRTTLEHQGSYLMSMLNYFSNTDLSQLKSNEDFVYFNVPILGLVSYSFSLITPMFFAAIVLLILMTFIGLKKQRLTVEDMVRGFAPSILSIVLSTAVGFGLWKLLLGFYPSYKEILHGFAYNGHTYIFAFALLSIGLCFWVYSKFYKPATTASFLVAPIVIWLIINAVVILKLKGAAFFIIPVYFALIGLFVLIRQRKPALWLMALLCFPALLIIAPFIKMFPVGLGLGILFVSCLFTALLFGLLVTVFGFFKNQRRWGNLFVLLGICFLIGAHFKSNFNEDRAKPNSLVYLLDSDNNEAHWATYDNILDDWTKNYIVEDEYELSGDANIFSSKYNNGFSQMVETDVKAIPEAHIEIIEDTIIGNERYFSVNIIQQRKVSRFDLFADTLLTFRDFKVNGIGAFKSPEDKNAFANRKSNRLFTYYVADEEPLKMSLVIPSNQQTKIEIYESSNDLLSNSLFSIPARSKAMITKPFILNDAVIVKKTLDIN